MLTLQEVKDWLRLEQGDSAEDALLQSLIDAATEYVRNAAPAGMTLGDNPVAAMVCRVLVADWYEHREAVGQVREDIRPTIRALVAQLQNAYPVIETARLPDAVVGVAYQAVLSAAGGAPPYTWSASGLPAGLALDADSGVVSGVPEAEAAATVTVELADSSTPPKRASRTVLLRVVAAP